MTIPVILLFAALVCFVLAALPGVAVRYVNLTPLGLALAVAAVIVAGGII